MVQQQAIRNIKNRLEYLQKTGKHQKDSLEYMGQISSSNFSKQVFITLDNTVSKQGREKMKTCKYRAAREIIVPIPHCLSKDLYHQREFIQRYIDELKNKYNLDNHFMWSAYIHNKVNDKGIKNFHAHIIFSERELLDEPIIKHYKKRYLNESGKICNKSEALKLPDGQLWCIEAHDKKLYFSENKNEIFKKMEFCYACDEIWKQVVLENNLMTNDELENIFVPDELEKTWHIGNKHETEDLSDFQKNKVLEHNRKAKEAFEEYKEQSKGFELVM